MKNQLGLKKILFEAVLWAFLILMSTIEAAPHHKNTQQHDTRKYGLEGDIDADSENGDLQGSSSFGYGYYSYPYLGGGSYGGYYPYYGGTYGLGYPYYGGYYGGYHGFHGHHW